jgi:hypothetical protein
MVVNGSLNRHGCRPSVGQSFFWLINKYWNRRQVYSDQTYSILKKKWDFILNISVKVDSERILEMPQVFLAMFVAYCECLTLYGNSSSFSDGFTYGSQTCSQHYPMLLLAWVCGIPLEQDIDLFTSNVLQEPLWNCSPSTVRLDDTGTGESRSRCYLGSEQSPYHASLLFCTFAFFIDLASVQKPSSAQWGPSLSGNGQLIHSISSFWLRSCRDLLT